MKNQCIKVLNEEHGKKVIEYFKSFEGDTKFYEGLSIGHYYGVFNLNLTPYDSEVIELPTEEPEFKRGDKVLVWDDDENNAAEHIFLATRGDAFFPYIVKTSSEDKPFIHYAWKNCKHAPQTVELTLQDISDGKGVGVDPKLIKIV